MLLEKALPAPVHSSGVVATVVDLFAARGRDAYFGERVTQLAHALQCAYLAVRADASDSLVAAALLHDIGHLLPGSDEGLAARGIDGCHEALGARWLEQHFSSSVTEPIRLHVPAKRYLCATDPEYLVGLSEASRISLLLQGGAFSRHAVKQFESFPYFDDAVRLRRWDDEAKRVGLGVPSLSAYLPLLHALARK